MDNKIEIYNFNNYELNIKNEVLKDLTYFKLLIAILVVDYKKFQQKDVEMDIDTYFKNVRFRIKSFQIHNNFIKYYSNLISDKNFLYDIIDNYKYNDRYTMIREINETSYIYTINNKNDMMAIYNLNTKYDYFCGLDKKDSDRERYRFKLMVMSVLHEILLDVDTFNKNKLVCLFFYITNEIDLIYYNLFCDIFNHYIDLIDEFNLKLKNITINNVIFNGTIEKCPLIKLTNIFNKVINIIPTLETKNNEIIKRNNNNYEYKYVNLGLTLPYIDDLWTYRYWYFNPFVKINNNKLYYKFIGKCITNSIFNTLFNNNDIINKIYHYYNNTDCFTLYHMKEMVINNDNINKYIISLFYILLFEHNKIELNDGILLNKLSNYFNKNNSDNINEIYKLIFSIFKINCNYISKYEKYTNDIIKKYNNIKSMLIVIKLNDIENEKYDYNIISCITFNNERYIYNSNNQLINYDWSNVNNNIVVNYFSIDDYENYDNYYLIDDIMFGSIINN